ncbi:unnamed protein product [Acanthoscelides obtectus]|uniref:CHK kinase-like domain-containing protein n=1 Tax=Acanthoscelides obtectus TaxID=200917 RepID=A0A9P0LR46_ACAOB|nr:unnamed protein product [Acanthoscelides obtectus]CAK1619980.1 hypothetical protein AOBTE_LOCUS111 [Acanthoscelides obtectus]
MLVPIWISKELFENSLKTFYNTKCIEIISYVSKDAVAVGENYTSDLFRTKVTFRLNKREKIEELSVIVKCGNEEGGVKEDMAKKLHLFEKEAEMYSRTFPAIYEILGKYYTLSAKCLYTAIEPHRVILMEDLTTSGFNVLPRHIGFDLEHCFMVVEKMAQMHSASVIMYEKDPSLVKHYSEGLYADNQIVRDWVSAGYKGLVDACSRWPGYEKFGYKLQALGEEALQRGFDAQKRKLGGFHVLNHGDLWVNNMMFSYGEGGELDDMRFVDFQMNIFTSPAIDLHYFIATSTKIEVKLECIEIILDHYYAQLLANLAKLQYSLERVPTREQFKKDYHYRAFFGLMGAATVLPFVKASNRADASFENIIKDASKEGFRYHAYNNERYRKHMEHLLPYYDSFSILD